jgi:ParB family chromosome partitioning protein
LGRGLDALIPPVDDDGSASRIPVDRIGRNPSQPRASFDDDQMAELAASIRTHGILQPIVVRAGLDGRYELIAGERRLRAARLAGLTEIPAVVRDSADGEQLELALVENLQRADLNPMEAASAYRALVDRFGLTHADVADRVGKSRVAVSNSLRLLDLAPETRQAISEVRISEGHGRALAALTIDEVQRAVLEIVIERGLSVRQTEELVRRRRPQRPRIGLPIAPELAEVEERLRRMLSTRVGVARTRHGGRLVIEFGSNEELERLLAIIERGSAAEVEEAYR